MPDIDIDAVQSCRNDILKIQVEEFGKISPVEITMRCVDPRHNNRTVISSVRQHTMEDIYGKSEVQRLICVYGLKNFNVAANDAMKNFDLTALGGRYSHELPRMIAFAADEAVRRYGVRLIRIYAADHEDDQCLAEKFGHRISWQDAIKRTLADLITVDYPERVDIYSLQITTFGSRPTSINHAAMYLQGGNGKYSQIINVPS